MDDLALRALASSRVSLAGLTDAELGALYERVAVEMSNRRQRATEDAIAALPERTRVIVVGARAQFYSDSPRRGEQTVMVRGISGRCWHVANGAGMTRGEGWYVWAHCGSTRISADAESPQVALLGDLSGDRVPLCNACAWKRGHS